MANDDAAPESAVDLARVARPFARLGWIGVWLQVALATLPIILLLYVVLRSPPVSGSGRGGDLLTMVLTLTAELVVLSLSLWLLYRMLRWAAGYDRAAGSQP